MAYVIERDLERLNQKADEYFEEQLKEQRRADNHKRLMRDARRYARRRRATRRMNYQLVLGLIAYIGCFVAQANGFIKAPLTSFLASLILAWCGLKFGGWLQLVREGEYFEYEED